ncbi:MAG TPA: RNase H family protein [Longimicrobiales bacterium]|nr:RNase H family protein [Longimicrobiales bacterium]
MVNSANFPPPMEPLVYIYADESCLGVQFTDRDSPGGAAGLIEYWRRDHWVRRDYWSADPATTNNRMAIRSAIDGLRALREPCRVIFTSDSQYLIRGMREWIHGWIRRGWRRGTGSLENAELWRELASEAARHQVDWRWIRGHAGHPQNEYANDLAIRAAKDQTASQGPVPSGFEEWLEVQREHGRYVDFIESAPPPDEEFRPATRPAVTRL